MLTRSHQWVNLVHEEENITAHLCKWLGYTPDGKQLSDMNIHSYFTKLIHSYAGAARLPKNVSSNCSDKDEENAVLIVDCGETPKTLSDCKCKKDKCKDCRRAGIHCQGTYTYHSS